MAVIEWLNNNAGAVQGIATVVLVAVTIYYAVSTKVIAGETRDMATATEHMTELTRDQYLNSTRPVIGFNIPRQHVYTWLSINITNVGVGPALDVNVEIVDSPLNYNLSNGPVFPVVLPVQQSTEIHYRVDTNTPFVDESLLRWPRDEEDEAALHQLKVPFERGSMGNAKRQAAEHEVGSRKAQFIRQVDEHASELSHLGTIRATYRDVHSRQYVSETRIGYSTLKRGGKQAIPEGLKIKECG